MESDTRQRTGGLVAAWQPPRATRPLPGDLSMPLPLALCLLATAAVATSPAISQLGTPAGAASGHYQLPAYASSVAHLSEGVPGTEPHELQVALVSARGLLAFWRPPPSEPQTESGKGCGSNSATSSNNNRSPDAELVAVEGATIRLNLVILGQLAAPQPEQDSAKVAQQPQAQNLLKKVRLEWRHNGQLLAGRRLQQQLLHFDLNLQGSFALHRLAGVAGFSLAGNSTATSASASLTLPSTSANLQTEVGGQYMLAPYADERHLARVQQLSGASQAMARRLLDSSPHLNLADDFLNDGRQVQWARLEAYLRLNSHQLRLLQPDHCLGKAQAEFSLNQVGVVQAELQAVEESEGGVYELRVCSAAGSGKCRSASFLLQVLEDAPQLVMRPEPRQLLLEPGDRLSIKCAATGFTLPQITWYLDGRQLSESAGGSMLQQQQREQQEQQGAGRLKVGDYVSQQALVLSFVNASQVEAQDAGHYKCVASNGRRQAEHEVRVDVRGPPALARRLANQSALAGVPELRLHCPYSGWPIATVEWFHLPAAATTGNPGQLVPTSGPDLMDRSGRARRLVHVSNEAAGLKFIAAVADDLNDPDKDEWLGQANAMQTAQPEPEYQGNPMELPEPEEVAPHQQLAQEDYSDYSDLEMDFQQQRVKRQADSSSSSSSSSSSGGGGGGGVAEWVKFPQSRRHQVHPNGSLLIRDLARQDQGLYKCRVHGVIDTLEQQVSRDSNEMLLTVLVAPVISPFGSSESLREGMRNFLTCSVIEGDAPIRLRWFKDGRPIEEHLSSDIAPDDAANSWPSTHHQRATNHHDHNHNHNHQQPARVSVELTNEFTSTLYFSHVDFADNGNYTCMASNKAASVNYTTRMLVNVPPKWIKTPKDLECSAGQNIVVDCQAQAYPAARVWWEIGVSTPSDQSSSTSAKMAPPIAQQHPPNHYRTIISNSRIHILENASLVIKEATKSDQGYYLCQAANNFGSLSALIKLTVNVGASFASKYLLKYARLNERVELDCDPSGQAQVDLAWFQRSPASSPTGLPTSPNQLNLTAGEGAVNQQQAQATAPQARSAQSSPGRPLFVATIKTEPSIATRAHTPHLEDMKPAEARHAPHDPNISFEVVRRSNGGDSGAELGRLVIKQARRFHSADYLCQASNRYGQDEKLIRLLVQEPPDPVEPEQVELAEKEAPRSLALKWRPPYSGNSPILSYTVEWRKKDVSMNPVEDHGGQVQGWLRQTTSAPSLVVGQLQPLTEYEFRVRAHNQLGTSSYPITTSSHFSAKTSEEPPAAPPTDIRATPLSSTSIQLSWRAPAPVSSNGPSGEGGPASSIKGYAVGYRAANASALHEAFTYKGVSALEAALDSGSQATNDSYARANAEATRFGVTIGDLRRSSRYTLIVQAFNSAGYGPHSDQLEAKTLSNDPPPAPQLRIGTITYASIELQWLFHQQLELMMQQQQSTAWLEPGEPTDTALDGYHLYFRPVDTSQWQERRLAPETHHLVASQHQRNELSLVESRVLPQALTQTQSQSQNDVSGSNNKSSHLGIAINNLPPVKVSSNDFLQTPALVVSPLQQRNGSWLLHKSFRYVLDQLQCGRPYQIYLVAYNSVGLGQASQIVRTKTRGSAPIAPRRQDFLQALNSTSVQLSLESWLDAGCSIANFQVRYRLGSASASSKNDDNAQQREDWLTVSNSLQPEQRLVELRDLQPETWYSVEVVAESEAGKSSAQYTFMTLDKFGQLPLEAIEALNSQQGSLPGLFRVGPNGISNPIRSILQTFSGSLSPLLMSGCLFILIFITCSLFLVKRYNSLLMKDTNHSSSLQAHHHYATSSNSSEYTSGPRRHHLTLGAPKQGFGASNNLQEGHLNHMHPAHHEHYSLKASPCKTTTTTILTGSSAGSQSSSGVVMGSSLCTSLGANTSDGAYNHQQLNTSSNDCGGNQFCSSEVAMGMSPSGACPMSSFIGGQSQPDQFCSSLNDDCIESPARFNTLNPPRDLQQQLRFANSKTLHRPQSFLQQQPIYQAQRFLCPQQQELNMQQQQDYEQQIYSKLRLIYNSHSSYNICPEANEKEVEQPGEQQIYSQDAQQLAAQQQKLLQALSRNAAAAAMYSNGCQQQAPSDQQQPQPQQGELASLLLDCHQPATLLTGPNYQNQAASYGTSSLTGASSSSGHTSSTQQDQQQQQQQRQPSKQQPGNNNLEQSLGAAPTNAEKSDYALPFPPNWV